jgi:hypothetical protein
MVAGVECNHPWGESKSQENMGKEENLSRLVGDFLQLARGKKREESVVEEWPTIVGIEDSLLKLVIVLRMRLVCL